MAEFLIHPVHMSEPFLCSALSQFFTSLPYLHPVPILHSTVVKLITKYYYITQLSLMKINIIPFPKMAKAMMLDEYHVS